MTVCGAAFDCCARAVLKCCDPIIYQVGSTEKPSPFQLLAAQAVIAQTLERNWYKDYLSHLEASDSKQETKEEAALLSYKERSVSWLASLSRWCEQLHSCRNVCGVCLLTTLSASGAD